MNIKKNSLFLISLVAILFSSNVGHIEAQQLDMEVIMAPGPSAFLIKDDAQNEVFRVQSDGNVGIGTTSPSEALDVFGTIAAKGLQGNSGIVPIKSTSDIEFMIDQNNSGPLLGFFELFNGAGSNIWSVNETGFMRVTGGASFSAGNVGIGKSSPIEKLEVAGKIRADSAFNLNGTDGVSGTLMLPSNVSFNGQFGAGVEIVISGGIITNVKVLPFIVQ